MYRIAMGSSAFEGVPGVAHAYPLDFGPIIARALAFVT